MQINQDRLRMQEEVKQIGSQSAVVVNDKFGFIELKFPKTKKRTEHMETIEIIETLRRMPIAGLNSFETPSSKNNV